MSRYFEWRPYVPVAQRRAKAARALAKLAKKNGVQADPVVLAGRTIATSFWGKAWCENLEAYSDFENRLPRGRTYVRNGSVVDLRIAPGSITARVSGSELYRVEITIRPLVAKLWETIRKECAGQIDSLLELLQGRLSAGVMQVVTRHDRGLFPKPAEIAMKCSCPDWAGMCKHVAATLYGVGARLDSRPELLFRLRAVDPEELIAGISAADAVQAATSAPTPAGLAESDLSAVFGIELDRGGIPSASPSPAAAISLKPKSRNRRATAKPKVNRRGKPKAPARRTGKTAAQYQRTR